MTKIQLRIIFAMVIIWQISLLCAVYRDGIGPLLFILGLIFIVDAFGLAVYWVRPFSGGQDD